VRVGLNSNVLSEGDRTKCAINYVASKVFRVCIKRDG